MKFYVYGLVDPRDGSVFYVGKGSGRRAWSHERRVANGHCRGCKDRRIASILAAGLSSEIRIIAFFESEMLAFSFERATIETLRDRLLNIASGGRRLPKIVPKLRAALLLEGLASTEELERQARTDRDRQLQRFVIDSLQKIAAA